MFVDSPYEIHDGVATVTDAPGWGAEIHPDWIAKAHHRISETGL